MSSVSGFAPPAAPEPPQDPAAEHRESLPDFFEVRALGRKAIQQMKDAEGELDAAHRALAAAEKEYRVGKLILWDAAPAGSQQYKKAWVEAESAEDREKRDICVGRVAVAKAALIRLDRQNASVKFFGDWARSIHGER